VQVANLEVLAAIHDCGAALATPATHLLVPPRSSAVPGPYNPTAAPQVVLPNNEGASGAQDSITHSGTEISSVPPIELQVSLPGVAGIREAVSAHATRSPPSSGAAGAAAAVAVKVASGTQHSHSVGTSATSRLTSANALTVPPTSAVHKFVDKPAAVPTATSEVEPPTPVSAAAWRA
jgi:cell division septation protein DedD